MSPATVVTFLPIKAAASFNSLSRRPVITTCAPSSTKRLAVARPIPLLPPVMTATLPSSVFMILLFRGLLDCLSSMRRAPDRRGLEARDCAGSDLRQAAVDGDLAAGHEAAVRRREKGSRRPDLRRIAHALERSHRAVDREARLAERFLRELGR